MMYIAVQVRRAVILRIRVQYGDCVMRVVLVSAFVSSLTLS